MDPLTVATSVVAILAPFVSKSAEEFAKVAGKSAYDQVTAMYAKLKSRWSDDQEATDALNRFDKKPGLYAPVLTGILEEKLTADNELAQELEAGLDQLGPQLHVIQQMDVADNVTGFDSDKMTEGHVSVTQDIKQATNVTGAKIKQFGK